MPRDRHQKGHVEETGKKVKKWKGHYFIYVTAEDGEEERKHRSVVLGPKATMKKWEAQKLLEAIIVKATNPSAVAVATEKPTLSWFWENRFKPLKEPTWKESSRGSLCDLIERYAVKPFRDVELKDIDKFSMQMHLNALAKTYSQSVVEKARIWLRAMLEEAVEMDFIVKNPARKLAMPETREVSKRIITPGEVASLMAQFKPLERLMLRILLVLGLRPGELLALRWDDLQGSALRIDEAARYGKIYKPKTKSSKAFVWLPNSIRVEILAWRSMVEESNWGNLMFPNSIGTPLRLDNFRSDVWRPACERARLSGVTMQACRRTCATAMQQHGGVKDIQAHLRHSRASTTLDEYVQEIPASVRAAVESLDLALIRLDEPASSLAY
jgi:integrase